MIELKLNDYLKIEGNTQKKLAALLNRSQGAVAKMRKIDRDIRLIFNNDNQLIDAYERKPICFKPESIDSNTRRVS